MQRKFLKRIPESSSNSLMDVVSEVESYGEFVPLCREVKIIKNLESNIFEKKFKANVFIEYKIFKEAFITEVSIDKLNKKIIIQSNESPFNKLYSEWTFNQVEKDCVVTFFVDVSFKSFVIEKVISLSFDRIAKKVISAFEGRVIRKKLI